MTKPFFESRNLILPLLLLLLFLAGCGEEFVSFEELAKNTDSFIGKEVRIKGIVEGMSSGATGEEMAYFVDLSEPGLTKDGYPILLSVFIEGESEIVENQWIEVEGRGVKDFRPFDVRAITPEKEFFIKAKAKDVKIISQTVLEKEKARCRNAIALLVDLDKDAQESFSCQALEDSSLEKCNTDAECGNWTGLVYPQCIKKSPEETSFKAGLERKFHHYDLSKKFTCKCFQGVCRYV